MAIDLLLHANKSDYLNLIGQLDGKLNELTALLGDYQLLKNNVDSFIQDGDSNYENMKANVEANIDAVRRAIATTQNNRDNLQKTVDQMDEMGGNVTRLIQESTEAAANTIKTAIRVDGLL